MTHVSGLSVAHDRAVKGAVRPRGREIANSGGDMKRGVGSALSLCAALRARAALLLGLANWRDNCYTYG